MGVGISCGTEYGARQTHPTLTAFGGTSVERYLDSIDYCPCKLEANLQYGFSTLDD